MGAFGSISSFGTVVLALTLVVTFYSGVTAALGARRGSVRLQRAGEYSLYGVLALLTLASALLIYAFVSHDSSRRPEMSAAMPNAYGMVMPT